MCIEDLNRLTLRRLDLRASHALTNIPVSSEEGCRTPIKRITVHSCIANRPTAKDGQSSTENAGVIEFGVREDVLGGLLDGHVVCKSPAFLQADYIQRGIIFGKLLSNFCKSLGSELADVL